MKCKLLPILAILFTLGTAPFHKSHAQILDSTSQISQGITDVLADTSFANKTEFGLNINQGSFSSNWTGGGINSIALGAFFNFLREKKWGRNMWRNDFQSQFGLLKNRGSLSRKNIDRIFFDSKYGYQLSDKWSLVANVNFLTQFAGGYEYIETTGGEEARKVSGFFSPAYLTEAVGIEYRPKDYFTIGFYPGALRQTFVTDKDIYLNTADQKNYGVPIGKSIRSEVALIQVIATFNKDIAENLNLSWRYQFYANARTLANTDHRLDAMLTAKVNKFVSVNLGAILLYDDDQSNELQFAQSLAFGLLYTF